MDREYEELGAPDNYTAPGYNPADDPESYENTQEKA